MASASVTEKKSKFDRLPIAVQMLIGIAVLLGIAIIGFAAFIAFDLLLLDWDPIGKLVSFIASLFTKAA